MRPTSSRRGPAAIAAGVLTAIGIVGAPAGPARAAAVTIELCAKAGTTDLPGRAGVPIWGFARKPAGVACTDAAVVADLPGPLLRVRRGDVVTVVVHNTLAEPVAVEFPGQALRPVLDGAAPGASASYTFTASTAGTFLYQAASNPAVQVPMGLYGALVVDSGDGTAYGSAATAYDADAVVVLSEINTALNTRADPNTFVPPVTTGWNPDYFLLSGRASPATAPIPAPIGRRLLVRYVNAGTLHHAVTLLGMHQTVVARESSPLPFSRAAVTEVLGPGQVADVVVSVPAGTPIGTRYPLYGRNARRSNGDSGGGGMQTTVEAVRAPRTHLTFTSAIGLPAGATNEDVLAVEGSTLVEVLDGTDRGIPATAVVDALDIEPSGTYLLSFAAPTVLPGLGTVDDSDVVRLGTGGFSRVLTGATVGLTLDAEDVDAVDLLASGQLLVSTLGAVGVPGVSAQDEDVLAFTPTTPGDYAAGAWSVWLNGTAAAVGLGGTGEDVDGIEILADGRVLVSVPDPATLPGVAATIPDEDVMACTPASMPPVQACTWAASPWFDGSTYGTADNDANAIAHW